MRTILLLLALTTLVSCHRRGTPEQEPATATGTSAVSSPAKAIEGSVLGARLEAALEISSIEQRDKALTKVASDAAASRAIDIMTKALDRISSIEQKDQSAAACAAALVRAGDSNAAKDAAMRISASDERDAALARIAAGK